MPELVPIMLLGWMPFAVGLFTLLPPRRAVIVAFLAAWLFLPEGGIPIPGLPDITKVTATSIGAMGGVMLFDAARLTRLRFRWFDIPVAAWCLSPIFASVSNGLGLYDGASGAIGHVFTWVIPYLLGRMYFNTLESIRELAIGILIAALVYVPLCLFEVRMSPQLHRWLYGYHPTHFAMTKRYGGYRPMVFMAHGLMVGLWMTIGTMMCVWLSQSRTVRQIYGIPMWVLSMALAGTTVLCKSTGALGLLVIGLGSLYAGKMMRLNWVIYLAVALAPAYMVMRLQGVWDGRELIEFAAMIDAERARSLAGRFENEDMIAAKALKQPLFGWGSWGRWRVYDEFGKDITVSDGMWIITLGQMGLVGLASLTATMLLPVVLLVRRIPVRDWGLPLTAPAAAIAMMLVLFSVDNLLNAMINPIYMLGAGGLSGLYITVPRMLAAQRRARRQRAAYPPRPIAPGDAMMPEPHAPVHRPSP